LCCSHRKSVTWVRSAWRREQRGPISPSHDTLPCHPHGAIGEDLTGIHHQVDGAAPIYGAEAGQVLRGVGCGADQGGPRHDVISLIQQEQVQVAKFIKVASSLAIASADAGVMGAPPSGRASNSLVGMPPPLPPPPHLPSSHLL
jgi:hypothetical protein